MTYQGLKKLTAALLTGDNNIPNNDDYIISLIEMSFFLIATKAQALRLLTLDLSDSILRTDEGDYAIRFPKLPTNDDDVLDIDHELCFASARFIASFISKYKREYHEQKAEEIIQYYNNKVETIMKKVREEYTNEDGYVGGYPIEGM